MNKTMSIVALVATLAANNVVANENNAEVNALIAAGWTLEQVIAAYGQSPLVEQFITIKAAADDQAQKGHSNGQENNDPPTP